MDRSHFLGLVENGDADDVRKALAIDVSLASSGLDGVQSPILAALYRNHTEIVSILTRHATLDTAEAAALGDAESLRRRLDEDAGSGLRYTSDGWSPLHLAAFFGRREAVAVLIAAGAPYGEGAESRNAMGNLPLHAALAGAGDEETVLCLLDAGAGAETPAAGGVTPLHLAASRGNQRLADILIARGAKVTARLDSGETPADIARDRGFPDVARALTTAQDTTRP